MNLAKRISLVLVVIFTTALSLSPARIASAASSTAATADLTHISDSLSSASGKTAPDGQPLSTLRRFSSRGADPLTSPTVPPTAAAPLLKPQPECPPGLTCKFVPAAYQQDDPADKSNYGNYDIADRPSNGLKINSIVIHDTEGSLASTLAEFQDPTSYVSAHYVIDTDGTVYQTVQTKNIAWHAGNWYTNQHSIGIEHVAHAVTGSADYTPAMYRSSALLVRYLSQKYNIPLDRQRLLGHDNVPAPTAGLVAGMHWDPGPYWNWQYYLTILGVPVYPTAGASSSLLTISPFWAINQPAVSDCSTGTCTTLPAQPANFIYLRTAPSDTAPLLSDPALHTDNSAGTTHIDDWSAKAVYGQQFAIAQRSGDWAAIWFGSQKGWFRNPGGLQNAMPTRGQYITPRAGLTSIPLYGRAYPEASAYTGTQVPVQTVVPLQYTIDAGQKYATTGITPTDYYWAWTIDSSLPDDHTLIVGQNRYLEIQYNGRVAYVKQSDITITSSN